MTTSTGSRTALDVATLAYCAGVVDVGGRITSRTVRVAVLPVLAVSSPNLELLNWLGELTGVRPFSTSRSYGRAACTIHCPDAHEHVISTSGRWSVSGVKATVVLAAVHPYLRLQGEAADEAVQLGLRVGRKPATVARMLELGWPIPAGLAHLAGEA